MHVESHGLFHRLHSQIGEYERLGGSRHVEREAALGIGRGTDRGAFYNDITSDDRPAVLIQNDTSRLFLRGGGK